MQLLLLLLLCVVCGQFASYCTCTDRCAFTTTHTVLPTAHTNRGIKNFALKALSKQAVIDRGQLSHVKDERLLLQALDHPFILKLYGTFQDKNSIFFLTEVSGLTVQDISIHRH
jgi:serine/threonine protein kinase